MTSSEMEYEKLFTKFYSDLFKFKNGKNSQLKCPGCQSDKRFIVNNDELIYSCGPKNDPKCGKQYTIKLPKYVNYRTFQKIYEENINGSFEYEENNILRNNLNKLSQKMDINKELETQNKIINDSKEKLNKLNKDYIDINKLDKYKEDLNDLALKRYKIEIEKRKIMRSIIEDELSEPEKVDLRKKYAGLIKENKSIIEMIENLNTDENNFIMIKNPEMINHKKLDEKPKDEIKEKPKIEKKPKKQKCSKVHPPPPCPEGKEVPEGKDCCYNEKKKKKPKKDSPKSEIEDKTKEVNKSKKYTFDEQVEILTEYYSKVDKNKTKEDVKRIVNNRRPKDKPKGTRIPTKPWLELCEKLNQKYNIHPLKM